MTKPGGDFVKAWREADRALAEVRPSRALDARVQASLSDTGRGWTWAGAAATAALAIALLVLFAGEKVEPRGDRPTPELAAAPPSDTVEKTPVTFVPASCAPAEERAELMLASGCKLLVESPSVSIEALSPVALRNRKDGIQLVRGSAAFEVTPVRSGPPVVVLVSGGRIRVVGTRFVIRESGIEGQVHLEEGRIIFSDRAGHETALAPGSVHRWAEAQAPKPAPRASLDDRPRNRGRTAAPAPRPVPPTSANGITPPIPAPVPSKAVVEAPVREEETPPAEWSTERTARAVTEVTELRAARRYRAAADLIGLLLQAPLDERAAEVLSFERGALLQQKLDDPAACQHWRRHRDRFAGGRYRSEVEAAITRCVKKEETDGFRRRE